MWLMLVGVACGRTTLDRPGNGINCTTGTACQGTCVDTQNDPTNCGSCGNDCLQGQMCISGMCTQCPAGETACNQQNTCANLQTDGDHCGTCGTCVKWAACTAVCRMRAYAAHD